MSIIKSFSKDTLQYGLGNSLKKLIGFLLLPFYTRALSPNDYGILETLGSLVMLLAIIFSLKIVDAGSRYYYMASDYRGKGKVLFTVLIICLISIIPCIFLLFFSESISKLLFGSKEYSTIVMISILTIPIVILNDEQTWIYRYLRLPWKYNFYIITKSLLNIGLGVTLVITLQMGVMGAQLASLTSSLIIVILSFIIFTHKQYTFNFSFKWAKKMLLFSTPLILSGILTWSYTLLDRFLLLGMKSTYDVGIYSIGNTFSQPISILNMAIGMSFYPFFMSMYEKDKTADHHYTKDNSNKIWYLYLSVGFTLCAFLSIFGGDLIGIIATPEYIAGATIIPFLVLSAIVRLSIDITSLGIFLKEKTIHYTWLVIITTIISIGLNLLLIPSLGFLGSAISNLSSTIVYFIIAYKLSQRFFHVKRRLLSIAFYFSFVAIISISFPLVEYYYHLKVSILLKFISMFVLILPPFLLKFVEIGKIKLLFQINK